MEIKETPLPLVWQMRKEVMYPDFTIEQVKLDNDSEGNHLGLYVDDRLVSVVSVFEEAGVLQFRKFATALAEQGKGYGSYLLQYVMDLAVTKHCAAIWCNARLSALPFYERFGMYAEGQSWTKHGIEFIKMNKQFK